MKKILAIIITTIISISVFGQYENTLYYLDRIPQANYSNPATNPDCKWWMGGLLIPIVGQVPTFPMAFQFNMPLSWSDIMYPGKGYMSNELITPWYPYDEEIMPGEYDKNTKKFYKKLKELNYFTEEFDLNLLNLGFRVKRNFFTIELSEKQRMQFAVPGDLIEFITRGNGNVRNADLSGFGASFLYYHQLAVGYNRRFGESLKVGAKVKLLAGVFNLTTEQSNMYVNTEEITNEIDINVDYKLQTNLPIKNIEYFNDRSLQDALDTLEIEEPDLSSSKEIMELTLFTKNYGLAFDLGAHYEINSDFAVHASVVDLGMIRWNKESSQFNLQGNYHFPGILDLNYSTLDELSELNEGDGNFGLDSLIQGVEDSTKVTATQGSYVTNLVPRIFVGGTYNVSTRFTLGLLARLDVRPRSWAQAYTASLNFKTFTFGNIGLSYSIINRSFVNIGLAYTVRIGPWQMFMATDNLPIFPIYAKTIGFRMGTNLVFGRQKKIKRVKKGLPMFNSL